MDVHARLLRPDDWKSVRDVNPSISFGTESIVEKALGLYPQQRYQTTTDMLLAFGFSPARIIEEPTQHFFACGLGQLWKIRSQREEVISNSRLMDLDFPPFPPIPARAAPQGVEQPQDSALLPSSDATRTMPGHTQVLGPRPKLALTLVRGILRMQIGLGKYIEFVRVPGGPFVMGSNAADDPHLHSDEDAGAPGRCE